VTTEALRGESILRYKFKAMLGGKGRRGGKGRERWGEGAKQVSTRIPIRENESRGDVGVGRNETGLPKDYCGDSTRPKSLRKKKGPGGRLEEKGRDLGGRTTGRETRRTAGSVPSRERGKSHGGTRRRGQKGQLRKREKANQGPSKGRI